MTMLQIPAVTMSATVKSIASHPPAMRTVSVRHGNMCKTAMENYCRRHPDLEALSYKEYHRTYILSKDAHLTPASYRKIGLVGGDTQYEMLNPPLVRFTNFNPASEPEAFAFNVLLEHVAFRDEGQALDATSSNHLLNYYNQERCYLTECILRGIIQDGDDLEDIVTKYCNDMLYNTYDVYAGVTRLQELRDPDLCFVDALDEPIDRPWLNVIADAAVVAEFAAIEASVPNEDQQAIIDSLVDDDTKGLHVICGGPGTGKTYVTQWIAHKHRAAGKSLVLSASTGAAATRLSKHALTNHVAYVLPVNGPARAVAFSDPLRAAVHMKATFILDEFSMTTSGQLDTILQRLQTLGGYSTVPAMLQEIKVVLVGDEKQVRHRLMNMPLPGSPISMHCSL